MEIVFTNTKEIAKNYYPTPASMSIPDWYKELDSYRRNGKVPPNNNIDQTNATIKRCMPVFDVMTSGYIIYTYTDLYISKENNIPYYQWASDDAISFHENIQVGGHYQESGYAIPKWHNPWAIKTPKGYSCLFVAPFHRKTNIHILEAIVDTDEYSSAVNFPFMLTDIKFQGLIPAGTPLAQVIPFKRESWEMKLGTEEDIKNSNKDFLKIRSKFYDGYKILARQKKEYK
jgi:hypothetical protein